MDHRLHSAAGVYSPTHACCCFFTRRLLNEAAPRPLFFFLIKTMCFWPHSFVAQMVNNLPAIQETWVQSLGREDPLEKGMATYSSVLAWRIPWTEESGRIRSMGS